MTSPIPIEHRISSWPDYAILLDGAHRGTTGETKVTALLMNGRCLYSQRIRLMDPTDQREWAERATGTDRPPVEVLERELVASIPSVLEVLQARQTPAATPSFPADDHRQPVDVGEQDLFVVTSNIWGAFEERNDPPRVFRHGNTVVRLLQPEEGGASLENLDKDRLRHEVARRVYCYRVEKGESVAAKPPMDVVGDMLATVRPPLPEIVRITSVPVFAPDGTIQVTPGYHSSTATYYAPDDHVQIPPISPNPSSQEIDDARELLIGQLLGDFPFESKADLANAVGLMLLPSVRDLIDGPTPLHLIEAPSPGCGKGLLAKAALLPGIGTNVAVITEARDVDEWRKKVTAAMLSGQQVLLIDNVTRPLDSGSLAAALTAPIWQDRILGASKIVTLPVRWLWLATANNPSLSAELARRSIRIRLDAKREQPWLRDAAEFQHPDLMAWATTHVGQLRWACLTITQAWIAAGRPEADVTPLGSFESWTRVIGGVLQVAKIPGFLTNVHQLYERADVEGAIWRAFVQEWWSQFGNRAVSTTELFPIVDGAEGIALRGANDQARKTSFGRQLSNQDGRIFGDYQIHALPRVHNSGRWQLSLVSGGGPGDVGGPSSTVPDWSSAPVSPDPPPRESPPTSSLSPEEVEDLAEFDRLLAQGPDICSGCGGTRWRKMPDGSMRCVECRGYL
jgi:putative DNA primase/helicase